MSFICNFQKEIPTHTLYVTYITYSKHMMNSAIFLCVEYMIRNKNGVLRKNCKIRKVYIKAIIDLSKK